MGNYHADIIRLLEALAAFCGFVLLMVWIRGLIGGD